MSASARTGYFSYQGICFRYMVWEKAHKDLTWEKAHKGRMPLVLVHGFAQSAGSWNDVALRFGAQHVVYALDLIGHGGSDKPACPSFYTLDAQGGALRAFLQQVVSETKEKPAVIGYSMGGRVALAALVADVAGFADTACALVLESAGLGFETVGEQMRAAKQDALRANRLRAEGLEAFMDEWERLSLFATQQYLPPETRACVRRARLANSAEALAKTFEQAGQHAMGNRKEILDALSAFTHLKGGVLYLAGALDNTYRRLSESLAASCSAHTELIGGAGHNIHLEAPGPFVCTVEHYLSEIFCERELMGDL